MRRCVPVLAVVLAMPALAQPPVETGPAGRMPVRAYAGAAPTACPAGINALSGRSPIGLATCAVRTRVEVGQRAPRIRLTRG